jgi:hypothetical protein
MRKQSLLAVATGLVLLSLLSHSIVAEVLQMEENQADCNDYTRKYAFSLTQRRFCRFFSSRILFTCLEVFRLFKSYIDPNALINSREMIVETPAEAQTEHAAAAPSRSLTAILLGGTGEIGKVRFYADSSLLWPF